MAKTKIIAVQKLICTECGKECKGRQWHNVRTGYGICNRCLIPTMSQLSLSQMITYFGLNGIHYNIA